MSAFRILILLLMALPLAGQSIAVPEADLPSPAWQAWSPSVFERARAENKLILLNMEAVWCHWCHVMDRETYARPEVMAVIGRHYIPVRVDADAHPALGNRYQRWGWPATIILDADGNELMRRRGYIRAEFMTPTLQAVADNPDPAEYDRPLPAVVPATRGQLDGQQRAKLIERHARFYDGEHGGWGTVHKFIHGETLDWAMTRAIDDDAANARMARRTLDAALALHDPVWGGVYQYSDQLDWQSPHYEKIASSQAVNLGAFARAYAIWGESKYLAAARSIYHFLIERWRDDSGAFYTSQDADLSAEVDGRAFYSMDAAMRTRYGAPRIDRNLYARENAWLISALTELYAVTGDAAVLRDAQAAAAWIESARRMSGGGYRHGEGSTDVFLGDQVAVGRAWLDLYTVTAERHWLDRAVATMQFLDATFRFADGGFRAQTEHNPLGVTVHFDSQIAVARLAARLYHHTGQSGFRAAGEHALRYLASETILGEPRLLSGILLADHELSVDPLHITVIGAKDDARSKALYLEALKVPAVHRRLEWWDRDEGPLPREDIRYPQLARPAAFVCTDGACSSPLHEPELLAGAVKRIRSLDKGLLRQSAGPAR